MTGTQSNSFSLLDKRIQHYIWSQKWESLRDAQELAIPAILTGNTDTIISAATAAGKTEAAFLPALSYLLSIDPNGLIIYIGPLKALINDQFLRLEKLCALLEIPVWPWHGDISSSIKSKFKKNPKGVLLITPESLEATLFNQGSSLYSIFSRLLFVIIDELHVFIGSERGKQLQSLLHRIEVIRSKRIIRIGLSATLGDMSLAAEFMCPNKTDAVAFIESKNASKDLLIKIRGFEEPAHIICQPTSAVINTLETGDKNADVDVTSKNKSKQPAIAPAQIAKSLFDVMRGSNNLIFPNSRTDVELFTNKLQELCEFNKVPNEFWPHHGNLSKELRSETEEALKQTEHPATAICTSTLELGIDIGSVKSVAQIYPPPSVASLKQRLGRSGRRDNEPEILRGYVVEKEFGNNNPSLADDLRLSTLEFTACISLLIEKWFEPPVLNGLHLSTLIQQILSVIGQNGGIYAGPLYQLLCSNCAPFSGITKCDFLDLLSNLGKKELLMQDSSGLLLHGRVGERIVNHFSFYAAFSSPAEFRIVAGDKTLGTLPVKMMLKKRQRILFAGRTWSIEDIDDDKKVIFVQRARGGVPPAFIGGRGRVHTKVRQRMYELLLSEDTPSYLDNMAIKFLVQARSFFKKKELESAKFIDQGEQVTLLTWLGDNANEALSCLLGLHGFSAIASGPTIEVQKRGSSVDSVIKVLNVISHCDLPNVDLLLADASNIEREKWDWALSPGMLRQSYASLYLDLPEAIDWATHVA